MKNLLVLLLLVVFVGALIWWLWSGSSEKEDVVEKTTTVSQEDKIPVAPSKSAQTDFKIVIDDQNRLVIEKLDGKDVNIVVTENETKDASLLEGILTYSEKENGQWSFRALQIDEYIAQNMQ